MSTTHAIARATAVIAVFTLLSRILGFLRVASILAGLRFGIVAVAVGNLVGNIAAMVLQKQMSGRNFLRREYP